MLISHIDARHFAVGYRHISLLIGRWIGVGRTVVSGLDGIVLSVIQRLRNFVPS